MILFKQKAKPDDAQVVSLFKFFNIPVPRGHGMILDFAECKKPDFLFTVNIKVMQKLYRVLNHENNKAKPEQANFFRFYVGYGNNHLAVKHVIKRRSWWLREKHEKFIN